MRWNGKRAKIKTVCWLRRTVKKKAWVVKKEHQGNKEYINKAVGCLHAACRYIHKKFFSTRVYGFSDLRNFFFFFSLSSVRVFVSLATFAYAYDFAHLLLFRLHARCQTISALIAIMSFELYSISISLIFSYKLFFFSLRFQSEMHSRSYAHAKLLVPFMKFAYSTNWVALKKNLRNRITFKFFTHITANVLL